MNTEGHEEKARRIIASLKKLDPSADALAIIDATMVAGYHLGSVVLHRHGLTDSSTHFNTPSKFEVPIDSLPAAVKPAYDAFVKLEDYRSHYVRSANQPDGEIAGNALKTLELMARHCGVGA